MLKNGIRPRMSSQTHTLTHSHTHTLTHTHTHTHSHTLTHTHSHTHTLTHSHTFTGAEERDPAADVVAHAAEDSRVHQGPLAQGPRPARPNLHPGLILINYFPYELIHLYFRIHTVIQVSKHKSRTPNPTPPPRRWWSSWCDSNRTSRRAPSRPALAPKTAF